MATLLHEDNIYSAPAALIFGDDRGRRGRVERIVERHGFRIVTSSPLDDAESRIAAQARAGLLVVDAAEDRGAMLDTVMAQVASARAGGVASAVVIAASATIDVVEAPLFDSETILLVDPDDREIDAAVACALAVEAEAPRLADSAGEASSQRLAQLSEEVGRIARVLATLSANDAGPVVPAAATAAGGRQRDTVAELSLIRAILRMRRLREQYFSLELFADPAWDMLLDLAAAAIEGRSVAVSSLCIAASVPATTALRWIALMTKQGLLVRRPDPEDGRRVFVGLSADAATAMTRYLVAAAQVMAPTR